MMQKNNGGYGVLLSSSRFSPFFTSQILTNLGDGLFSVSLIYYALQIGVSSTLLGSIVFTITLARGLLGPFGGVISDRVDRRYYLITMEAMRAMSILLIPLLAWAGWMSVWWLIVIGIIVSTLFAISVPAAKAMIPKMVDKQQLQQANGLIQTITWPAFFLGSALLALFQGKLPAFALFIIIGGAFVISALLLCGLPKATKPISGNPCLTPVVFVQELRNGYQALNVDSVMRVRVWLYGAFTFFWRGSLQICTPVLILRHLESPQWLYGSLMFVNGLAELLANLYVGKRFLARPLIFTYSCEILMGVGLLFMVGSLWLPFTYLWFFIAIILIGVAAATIDIPLMTVIQKQVPAEHVGKVVSYWFTIGSFGGAMGSLLLGMLFDAISVGAGIIIAGGCCLLIGVIFYLWAIKRNTYIT